MARVTGGRKLKEFLRKARSAQARSKTVAVGFFSTAKYPDGTPVAAVAAWQEFGVPANNIPERPFFRRSLEDAEEVIMPVLIDGIDPKDMAMNRVTAGKVGLAMQSHIQREITTLIEPPNKPYTVLRKGSSSPLVDTGFMRQSVSHVVEDD